MLGKRRMDGQIEVRLSKNSADILDGNPSDWTDEELLRGQRKSKRGRWEGKPPQVVPMAVHQELIRRRYFSGEAEIREAVLPAAQYIAAVVRGTEKADTGRLKACEMVLERFFGKPRQYIDLDVTQTEAPWQKALNLAIVGSLEQASQRQLEEKIVDAEVIDPDEVIEPWLPDDVVDPYDSDEPIQKVEPQPYNVWTSPPPRPRSRSEV